MYAAQQHTIQNTIYYYNFFQKFVLYIYILILIILVIEYLKHYLNIYEKLQKQNIAHKLYVVVYT